jgi:hypothetical protein
MSRRKHERRLEASYGIVLTPWILGLLTVGILLTRLSTSAPCPCEYEDLWGDDVARKPWPSLVLPLIGFARTHLNGLVTDCPRSTTTYSFRHVGVKGQAQLARSWNLSRSQQSSLCSASTQA